MRTMICTLLLAGLAQVGGLAALDRKIAKEPKYVAAEQYYALLVLGAEPQKRVWLVADGESLYLDRNANGDLTEEGERFPLSSTGDPDHFVTRWREWKVPGLTESDRYSDIRVRIGSLSSTWRPAGDARNHVYLNRFMDAAARTPHANLSNIHVTIGGSRTQFCNAMFSTAAATAPVFQMDAPLTVGVIEQLTPHVFDRSPGLERIQVAVGTPGWGGDQPGCFSYLMYEGLPDAARPVLEIEFPGADGKLLPSRRYPLDEKC